ncbi:zinc finger protein GLIS2 homolog [Diorhabda carinulata]|uniref:zinc finger protein GLIS2 homolog n=1 Tax=Diorhabda carinulata TaxID=1163345 RepID=UPI0025A11338|nr:zinc finger protein GLIS2 homolog [Diorhabda carinulata]
MLISRYRIEGQPLYYYYPYIYQDDDKCSYLKPLDHNSGKLVMSHETLPPASPISTQSDSENSVSSIEIPKKELRSTSTFIKNTQLLPQVQCRWRSCGILFSSLDQLALHVTKVHSASGVGGLFYCGWDGCTRNNRGFNARYKMLVHVRTHTNEKPHKCFQCEKSFSRAENLKIHSRSHSGEKPYVCPVPGCNKAYSNSSDRFKHSRTHQVDKPYQCKIPGCSKKYTDPSSLRKHVKTYKHFVNENQNTLSVQPILETEVEDRLSNTEPLFRENVIRHPCNCNRACCITKCMISRSELFKIGNLIDIKESENTPSWNTLTKQPYISEPNDGIPYEEMQVDGPLDLSLHRRKC